MVLAIVAMLTATLAPPAAGYSSPARRDDGGHLGFRLIDVPAARVDDPRARTYIIDAVKPGASIRRRMEVNNATGAMQTVELYAGAATVTDNTFTAADDRTANELSSWVSLETPVLEIPAHTKEAVWATISVPKTASKGERYAAVWAQVSGKREPGRNVIQVVRVGIRIYLDVGPGGELPTEFRIDHVTVHREAGQWPVIAATVHNVGGRAVDMVGSVSLSNGDGAIKAGPFKVTNGITILPGGSGEVTVLLDRPLPPGDWDVELTLQSGTVERKVSTRLTVPGPVPVKQPRRWWLYLAAGAAVALAAGVALFLILRRRTRGPAGSPAA